MATEQVRMWRPADEERIVLLAGQTANYAVEPRGEYFIGVNAGQPMRSRRGRETRLVPPGQVIAWDPSAAHTGTAVDGRPWASRLLVVEVTGLAALAGDTELSALGDVSFPEPVISDPELARDFLRLHTALELPTTRLERDERLAQWLRVLVERSPTVRTPRARLSARDDRALRLARDYLGDRATQNVSLDDLAAAAGIGKFRLIRLFRERTGLPPHALLIAHRIRTARLLLEAGHTIAHTATAAGFTDQSHLHYHLQRSLGVTPADYQRRFTRAARPAPPDDHSPAT
jgi:AraC-like DNA-binding protein